jgi:hypothetical protein
MQSDREQLRSVNTTLSRKTAVLADPAPSGLPGSDVSDPHVVVDDSAWRLRV